MPIMEKIYCIYMMLIYNKGYKEGDQMMEDTVIRLQEIQVDNFKNVEHGIVNFQSYLAEEYFSSKAEILGIYGQNGSGKTAVIDALNFLQKILTGVSLPKDAAEYILKTSDKASLQFTFSLESEKVKALVYYGFTIRKSENKVVVSNEKVAYSIFENGKRLRRKTVIEYDMDDKGLIFKPKKQYMEFLKSNNENIVSLNVAKKLSLLNVTSFIFSTEGLAAFEENFQDKIFVLALKSLRFFAEMNLFVINNQNTGAISMNLLIPLVFKHQGENSVTKGTMPIALSEPSIIKADRFDLISNIINQMNIVLSAIIPGLKIGIKNYGKQLLEDGTDGVKIELVSVRKDIMIPLRYESEGIIKIISILNSMIAMYHDPRICIAVDELDAGVFEYLLGEILQILEGSGKGQLVFTSHNLRVLETIDKNSILFTTVNPQNRYIRFANVKNSNNLRDLYIRSITLGGQTECLYDETDKYEIRRAFRIAGKEILR
jgi:AAA15 family ATPase/GTPase